MLAGGRLIAQGRPRELRGAPYLRVGTSSEDAAVAVAAGIPGVSQVEAAPGHVRLHLESYANRDIAAINRQLTSAGVEVSELAIVRTPLRQAFLDLTGGQTGGAGSVREDHSQGPRRWFGARIASR